MHFNEEHFEKRFLFKRKHIIRKQQYTRIKQRQPRGRQNFKVKFLTTNQTNMVRVGANLHEFRWSPRIKFNEQTSKQITKRP